MSNLVMFRLLDKKVDEGSHFINEDGTIDRDKKIDFNNRYGVLNPYFVKDAKGAKIYKRYIAGCPTYDIAEQDKGGYVFDLTTGLIEFKAGGDIIVDKTENQILVDFLKDHCNNTKSKFHKQDVHEGLFFTYDPKEALKEEVKIADAEDEALQIVLSLKNDKARLRAVANLFKETNGLIDDDDIYLRLREMALESPVDFTKSIASKEKAVMGDILLATKHTIINRDVKGFYFEGTEGVIFLPTTKNEKDVLNEFVKFLMSKEGQEPYKQILIKIQQKQVELDAPKGELEDAKK